MKKLIALGFTALLGFTGALHAAEYKIDTAGAHAFVQFKIKQRKLNLPEHLHARLKVLSGQ